MRYNVFISYSGGSYNLMGLTKDELEIVIKAYHLGKNSFTISGKKYYIKNISEFQIYTHEKVKEDPDIFFKIMVEKDYVSYNLGHIGPYLTQDILEKVGTNVTKDFIGNSEYGETKDVVDGDEKETKYLVNLSRIEELRGCKSNDFDLVKLIRLCEELNDNYNRENYLSVAMIERSIINHIPPIFGHKTFIEVANNYVGKSKKKSLQNLEKSLRNIADSFLHETISKKEVLPTSTQVNFSQDLDVLLGEIVRQLST